MERVSTSLSGKRVLSEDVRIDGVIVALKIFSTGNEIAIEDYSNNFILKTEHNRSYPAASLPSHIFPDGWTSFGKEEIWLKPGESTNCIVGASLPDDTKITQIIFEESRGGILTSAQTIELDINYETRDELGQLPTEIRHTI